MKKRNIFFMILGILAIAGRTFAGDLETGQRLTSPRLMQTQLGFLA